VENTILRAVAIDRAAGNTKAPLYKQGC